MDNQEQFWASSFGDEYSNRNKSNALLESNIKFFQRALEKVESQPEAILELGSNIGMNFLALQEFLPEIRFTGVEINEEAHMELAKTGCNAVRGSVYDYETTERFDLVFTKGVLIHLNPERLTEIYDKLYSLSKAFILVAEYYNPVPTQVAYRGHDEKLFKRDFAGDMLDRFPDLELYDYGFAYHRDPFPQDDISWFLLKKQF
jgi:spore coat polysaccharide biosynthesis protein SpsF